MKKEIEMKKIEMKKEKEMKKEMKKGKRTFGILHWLLQHTCGTSGKRPPHQSRTFKAYIYHQ